MDLFEQPAGRDLTPCFSTRVAPEQLQLQAANTTRMALQDLIATVRRDPSLYLRTQTRRQREQHGPLGQLWGMVSDYLSPPEPTMQIPATQRQQAQLINGLVQEMKACYEYAYDQPFDRHTKSASAAAVAITAMPLPVISATKTTDDATKATNVMPSPHTTSSAVAVPAPPTPPPVLSLTKENDGATQAPTNQLLEELRAKAEQLRCRTTQQGGVQVRIVDTDADEGARPAKRVKHDTDLLDSIAAAGQRVHEKHSAEWGGIGFVTPRTKRRESQRKKRQTPDNLIHKALMSKFFNANRSTFDISSADFTP